MKVAIHQPNYLPYIGYFQKMASSDIFVILDNVQFSKDSFTQRTKIRTPNGWMWLTIPIEKKYFYQPIFDIFLPEDKSWLKKHKMSLTSNYSNCRFFDKEFIENYFVKGTTFEKLQDWNEFGIFYLKDILGIKSKIIRASELDLSSDLKATDLLIEILNKVGGTTYISGIGGKKYMDTKCFEDKNISLEFYEFKPFDYKQRWKGFEPYLSTLDLLFNMGDEGIDYIQQVGYK